MMKTLIEANTKTPVIEIGLIENEKDKIWADRKGKQTVVYEVLSEGSLQESTSNNENRANEKTDKKKLFASYSSSSVCSNNFSALDSNGRLVVGSLNSAQQKTDLHSVKLSQDKYKLQSGVHLFKDIAGGTFVVYSTANDDQRLQYWNTNLSAVTLDIALNVGTSVKQILFLQELNLIIVLADDGKVLATQCSLLSKPADVTVPFVVGQHANNTLNILRFRNFTQHFIAKEEKQPVCFRVMSDGKVITDEESEYKKVAEFSPKVIQSLSDAELLKKIEAYGNLTPILASQIIDGIYQAQQKSNNDSYYTTLHHICSSDTALEQVPKEQVHYILRNILENRNKLKDNATPLILRCCELLSQFDKDQKSILPLDVLPIIVDNFNPTKGWMIDISNLLIDTHFRSIASNKELLESLKQLKQQVADLEKVREREMKLKGMVQLFASASISRKEKPSNGAVLINF